MKTDVKNGQGSKTEAAQKADTSKGVAAMATVEAKKETTKPEPLNPLQERLKRISEIQKLSVKRRTLIDAQDKLTHFEEGLTGEGEEISLGSGRNSVEITKPDAVRKVAEFLKADVRTALAEVDNQLLSITL